MLLGLAVIWGASFLFIEVALRELAPETVILIRIALGAFALGVYVLLGRRGVSGIRAYLPALALMGALNTALPFFLITWGQQYIDSGLAAIFNSSAPIFTAVFALGLDRSQRATGLRLAGILLGFAGVVALVGFEPDGGDRAVWGSLAVVGAAVCYSFAALYAGRRFVGLHPELVALGSLCWATLFVLPPGLAAASSFGWETLASVLFLGVAATAAGYLLYFGLIAGAGASRAILVTYLVPSLALVYGALLLDETVSAVSLVGLALVLGGVALGTGTVRR
jgi:drug/metabolite transporter (DMT)-like permease